VKVVVGDRNLVPHRDRLESALPDDVTVCWADGPVADDLLADADVFVGGRFTAKMGAVAQRLRLVHTAGAGTDKIDFAALPPDMLVANTFHHESSMAEYIVAATVLLRRHFLDQDRALRTGRWASSVYDRSIAQPSSLRGARVGFVGFGHIGRRSWELFRAFGADGAAVTGRGNLDAAAEGLRWAAGTDRLQALMTESDVVVVSAPLTEHSVGMIGAAELAGLGPHGVLVNVGRGPLVVEDQLYEALSVGTIAAAAIDVWYRYPGADGYGDPSALPFHELPNVLMTPHSSGITTDTFTGRVDDIAANIGRLHRGEPLHNLVDR
jgi:phosphoglycerate dehydrogenase-like enzyme